MKKSASWIIVVLSCLLFIPFLGEVHLFDWDEINFAECAREMLVSGNYLNLQMNFNPFWEKPPLFIWMQALSMKTFGVNEFAARFPNAICGILTLLIIFRIGKTIAGEKRAWLWILCYAGSTLPQFYFRSGIIDPWFNLFIFLSFYYFLKYAGTDVSLKNLILAAFFAGLALLTKGPAALIILFLATFVFYAFRRFKSLMPLKHFLLLGFVIMMVGGLWFILLLTRGKFEIIENFVSYQYHLFHAEDSGHGGPIYYHIIVLLIGCFPASLFALKYIFKKAEGSEEDTFFSSGMQILFWVVLILFSVVQTKIVHYSSLCYFPLTWLAAKGIEDLWDKKSHIKKGTLILIVLVGTLLSSALMLLPVLGLNKNAIIQSGYVSDQMVKANLNANVYWSGFEILVGLALLFALIFFVFGNSKHFKLSVLVLFLSNLMVTQLASTILAPKIEGYTQKAVIDFYESLQQKDCYAESLHYLSYAPYFYARKLPPDMPEKEIRHWMLNGEIDKPCYFVCKITDAKNVRHDFPQLTELKRQNGFVFFERLPAK